jgi:hypothetical protein
VAKHINKDDLQKIELVKYEDIRSKIETGMLFFTSGDYPISKAIQKFSKSPWSHVGILFNDPYLERVMILESVEDMGVRFIPFSWYVNNYHGEVIVANFDYKKLGWFAHGHEEYNIVPVLAKGIDRILKKYDKPEFVRILHRIIDGKGKVHDNDMDICSELVERIYRPIYQFKFDTKGYITPENEWQDENVELLWRVK